MGLIFCRGAAKELKKDIDHPPYMQLLQYYTSLIHYSQPFEPSKRKTIDLLDRAIKYQHLQQCRLTNVIS